MAEHRPTFGTSLSYRDRRAALAWLERAFGFEPTLVITGADGELGHAEMSFGSGYVIVAGEASQWRRFSPQTLGGQTTNAMVVRLQGGIDAHCERARAAGAVVQIEPQTQPYGDRTYQAMDPEGHVWMFAEAVIQEAADG